LKHSVIPGLSALLVLFGGVCAPAAAFAAASAAPVSLKTTDLGSGATIVIVHNLGSARMSWLPVARKLLGKYRVVLVDLPGHGDSPMPDPFSLAAAASAIDAVLAQQKGDSTVVVGHGLGGTLALMAVAKNPGHAKGVAVIDATLKAPTAIPDAQRKMFLSWLDENFDAFLTQVYAKQGRDSTQSAELLAQASLVPRANLKQYYIALLDLDGSAALKDFKRPLVYIASDRAWPVGQTWASVAKERGFDLAAAIDTVRIPASGQLITKDQPDSLASAIAAFAAKVLAGK